MNVEVIEFKTKKLPMIYILQIILCIASAITGIMTLVDHKWIALFYGVLAPTLLVMGIFNIKLKRKLISAIYFIFSLVTFVSMVLELL